MKTPAARGLEWVRGQSVALALVWLAIFSMHIVQADISWFSIDQARDVLQASDIAAGRHFPMIGPPMHWIARLGPPYFYVLALPFLFSADPHGAYVLLALQATATAALGYFFLRRYFPGRAAGVFLVLYAPATFVLLDSRALWTPAFLPFWSMLALWASARVFWEGKQIGVVALAAIVGIASQFHPSFLLIIPVLFVGYVIHRPHLQPVTIRVALAVGALTYAPYLYSQATSAWMDIRAFIYFVRHTEVGLGAAPPLPMNQRLINYLLTPYYLSVTWLQLTGLWLVAFRIVTVAFAGVLIVSLVWLTARAVTSRSQQPQYSARVALLLAWFVLPTATLLLRSRDLYYYYFDVVLPLPFMLPALAIDEGMRRLENRRLRRWILPLASSLLVAYVFIEAGAAFQWITRTARDGLFSLSLQGLDLHRFQSASVRPQDQFMSLRYKAQLAKALVEGTGWSREDMYANVLGSRFYDATEERGFWIGYFKPSSFKKASDTPVVLWHAGDPLARWAAKLGVQTETVGPFSWGPVPPAASPQLWRQEGREVHTPVRVVPELREYGFVGETVWTQNPVRLVGRLDLDQRPKEYLLVVITKGEKLLPHMVINGRTCQPVETNETLMTMESYFVLDQELTAGDNTLEMTLEHTANFDLETFGWAKW